MNQQTDFLPYRFTLKILNKSSILSEPGPLNSSKYDTFLV